MAGEGEGRAEEEWAGLEGPSREGSNETSGLERVIIVRLMGVKVWEVGGDETQRVVLGA